MNQEQENKIPGRCSLCGKAREMKHWLCSDDCLKRQWNKNEFFKHYEARKENQSSKKRS